jgi:hypothetical protein
MNYLALFAAGAGKGGGGGGGQGGGDWIVFVVAIIIFIVSVISKLSKAAREGKQRPPPQPAQRPQGKALEDEIGEFMRRAAKRQAGKSPPPKPARPVAAKPVEVEVVKEKPLGGALSEHVQDYLDTGEFNQRSASLGSEVTQEVSQLDQRLHGVFDHQISDLAAKPGETSMPTTAQDSPLPEDQATGATLVTAAGIFAVLSDPENVRQAIVINEILRRPEDRWG